MSKYKITLNMNDCIGCSTCCTLCRELFEQSPENKVSVKKLTKQGDSWIGELDEETITAARQAEAECPVMVIKIEEID